MDKAEMIRRRLKEMASEIGPSFTMLAQVKNVDLTAFTCDLHDEDSGLDFFGVRLRPVLNGTSSLTIIPKMDTWALAVRIEDSDDWMIVAVGEMDKYLVDCDQIIINGGSKGGLLNWTDAKQQHDLVKQFITAFKNVLSTPVNEPGSGAPSAFQAALNAVISGIQTPSFENLEDVKVKH